MKTLKANIMHQKTSGVYLGFIHDYPAICAQGDSIDSVLDKLNSFSKKYFDYMSQCAIEADKDLVEL